MQTVITCYWKNVYGVTMLFPADETVALAHQLISGRKTLSDEHKEGYEALGFKFKEIPAPAEPSA